MDQLNFNLSSNKSFIADIKTPVPAPRPVPVPRPRKNLLSESSDSTKIDYGDGNNIGFKMNIGSNGDEKSSGVNSFCLDFNSSFNSELCQPRPSEASLFNECAKPFQLTKFYFDELNTKSSKNILGNFNGKTFDDTFTPLFIQIPHVDEGYGKIPLFENESELSKGRKKLQLLVKNNASSDNKRVVAEDLLKLDLPINLKYEVLDISCFLQSNKDVNLSEIPTAFNLLEKYGMTLLKEESLRHPSWRKISTSSGFYKNSIGSVKGADKIIESMGYTEKLKLITGDILVFPLGVNPNILLVMNLVVDLLIAKYEIDSLLNQRHPFFEKLNMTGSIPDVYFAYNVPNIVQTFAVEQRDSLVYEGPKSLEFVFNTPISAESSFISNINMPTESLCPKCSCKFFEQPKYCSNCGYKILDNHQTHENLHKKLDNPSLLDKQSKIKTDPKQEPFKKNLLSSSEVGQMMGNERFKPQQWSCQHCTFLNESSVSICKICELPSSNQNKLNESVTTKLDSKQQIDNKQLIDCKPQIDNKQQVDNKQQIENALKQQHIIQKNKEEKLKKEKEHQLQLVISTQNKMKQSALNIAKIFQIAEKEGFSIQLCEMALLGVENHEWHNIMIWIKEQLPKLTSRLMEYSKHAFSQREEILSEKEAHKFLYDFNIDMRSAFEAFQIKREKQVLDLKKKFSVTDLEIHNFLFISEGDQLKVEELLYKNTNVNRIKDMLKTTSEVFFKKLTDPNISDEAKCRMILGEYPKLSWGRAEMCLKLIKLSTYETEDCIEAVQNNLYYDECKQFLECSCCICYNIYPRHKLTSNLHCQCQYCLECYITYLDVSITSNHIRNLVCANCQLPTEEAAHKSDYFNNLDTQIHYFSDTNKLAPERYTLFQEKLRDFNLLSDPKFRWCAHCPSYGFIWEIDDNKMRCNKCDHYTCFLCKEKWLPQHDGISCEKFKEWKVANDPELQTACAADLLSKNGIECPECHFKYILVRGGCMHFTCSQCGYEFCSGCFMGFLKGARCQVNPECATKGLHAHHPRDCYFFLRDRSVDELRNFLENSNIEFDKDKPDDKINDHCTIPISEDNLDKPCGNDSPENMAGLCEKHYIEYLVALVNKNNLDPVLILSIEELNIVLKRSYKVLLVKNENEVIEDFHKRLQEYVCTELPLLKRK